LVLATLKMAIWHREVLKMAAFVYIPIYGFIHYHYLVNTPEEARKLGEKYYEKYGFNVASSEVSEESNEEAKKIERFGRNKRTIEKIRSIEKEK